MEKDLRKKKKRINIQSTFSERIIEFNQIEENLIKYIELLEEQKKETNKVIKEINKKVIELRETKEYWREIEEELDDKEWCKKEFVNEIDKKLILIEKKWNDFEKNLYININNLKSNLFQNYSFHFYYPKNIG